MAPLTEATNPLLAARRRILRPSSFSPGSFWWSGPGLNRQPPACKTGALPVELPPQTGTSSGAASRRREPARRPLVGLGRIELPTSPLSGARSSHLSYRPTAARLRRRQGRLKPQLLASHFWRARLVGTAGSSFRLCLRAPGDESSAPLSEPLDFSKSFRTGHPRSLKTE